MRILVIEDDPLIGSGVEAGLRQQDWAVDWVTHKAQAVSALQAETFDAAVLDLGLPDGSGLTLLRSLRSAGDSLPVLILTARDAVEDRTAGLDSGADDYLTKPFDLDELAARLRAIVRRHQGRSGNALSVGNIVLDPTAHTTTVDDQPLDLSRREFSTLQALMESAGKVLTAEQLEQKLYGWGEELDSNAIQVHVHHLRKKLGNNEVIRTIRGVGYTIDQNSE
jgi:DNA-binding response OmpR family regulator